ncbi:MAG: type II toxin-antitoxin system PemK/MazF family toxin [Firmicutes bacterium]|nr:type II toxin-antitoxin system PemK/MazF family toxin [Bacillota bacterium]
MYERGSIYLADIGDNGIGSEQNGRRPVLIVQNDIGNRFSPTVIVACITSRTTKANLPTHVKWNESTVLCEQIKTIDKTRLIHKIDTLSFDDMQKIARAIRISLDV